MTMPSPHVDDASTDHAGLVAASCLFGALGDPSRLTILRHLALGEHRVVDLTTHLGLAQSTVSQHLACLRDCGLVRSRAEGRASRYSLAHPEATLGLLATAERLLGLTGEAVVLCPVSGLDGSRAASREGGAGRGDGTTAPPAEPAR